VLRAINYAASLSIPSSRIKNRPVPVKMGCLLSAVPIGNFESIRTEALTPRYQEQSSQDAFNLPRANLCKTGFKGLRSSSMDEVSHSLDALRSPNVLRHGETRNYPLNFSLSPRRRRSPFLTTTRVARGRLIARTESGKKMCSIVISTDSEGSPLLYYKFQISSRGHLPRTKFDFSTFCFPPART